jgi:hypothetical protein
MASVGSPFRRKRKGEEVEEDWVTPDTHSPDAEPPSHPSTAADADLYKKAGWTAQEDATVHAAVRALGTQWGAVAEWLPGEASAPTPRRPTRLPLPDMPLGAIRRSLRAARAPLPRTYGGRGAQPMAPSAEAWG